MRQALNHSYRFLRRAKSVRTLCIRLPKVVLFLFLLLGAGSLAAQNTDQQIAAQKRLIADLEKQIAREEQEISKLKKGRASAEETVRRLARQIDSRNQLLDVTERDARKLEVEVARTDSVARGLSASLDAHKRRYAEMVREAYRNYKHNNYLTYIFSSRDFADMARKITNLREVASMRERKLQDIAALSKQVAEEKELLDRRKRSLDSVTLKLKAQKQKLERDARNARTSIRQLSQKEKTALQRKISQEQQLDVAIGELRKLTKGNKEGDSFSTKTTGLRLPVTAGRVKRYKENMAEITGPKGAHVISIYDGKVVDVKRNRITNKYDVYVAHGEYITSYANMGSICVEKGQKVARNAQLGTIGSAVNIMTMETEYKLVFGIYPPNPGQKLRAENCFKK
jgi:peptidoglycan hydrolase CwlO-like protein